jgi:phosphoenolpyruvate synthase/pyruvate phosphate dikinase
MNRIRMNREIFVIEDSWGRAKGVVRWVVKDQEGVCRDPLHLNPEDKAIYRKKSDAALAARILDREAAIKRLRASNGFSNHSDMISPEISGLLMKITEGK